MDVAVAILIIVAALMLMASADQRRWRKRKTEPIGTTRIETNIPTTGANRLIKQYAEAGWTVVDQSSAKSFGRSAKLAITFRKEGPPKTRG